ncbi:hypothetical protein C0966_17000 (plasmid) [Bacillus methanolicus]|uniref:LPD1 domain-containing protein n=1 Tax=Bacillus methanolicus TaxID=1471 RepID=UPI002380256B|nr:LPD1 domain-containing protein [Bacillus methanolicus]MDE3840965.1 hypothetical protein [Bacillus methanolicus]
METQLSLFHIAKEDNVHLDIRTVQQASKKVAYDVGEKIGGARKDMAALRKEFEKKQSLTLLEEIENISTVLAAEIITKHELFKGFSLEKEKENGTEPAVARAKQLLIQRVDATPAIDSKESRLKFMKAAQYLLSKMESVRVWDDLYPFLNDLAESIRNESNNPSFYEKRLDAIMAELETLENGTEEWKEAYRKGLIFKESLRKCQKAKELGLRSLGEKFCNFFKSNQSYRSTLTNALKVQSWDDLLNKKEKKKVSTRKPVWERNFPERPDRIGGAQSTIEKPEDLLTFFQFRGVEFGHYIGDQKGMEHLLRSSEAMMDLAELLGLDYSSISLNGTLAMAYGARGRGGNSLAHYEPLSKVINMTKEKGCLGVLAHEWFHALDNHLYDLSHNSKNGKRGYASEPETLGDNVDSYLKLLFEELMEVIKKGNSVSYYENTNKPGDKWRGTIFKQSYKHHNGDLFKAMEKKVAIERSNLEAHLRLASYYTYTDKDVEKLMKKHERAIKEFALALAWYHENQTGERVEQIPYPSEKSQYLQASIGLDKGKEGKYWSSNIELAARAFESFIQDKLKAAGRKNDYLVAGTHDGLAFPMGEEREAINQKFEEIIKFIKELKLI